MKKFKNQWNYKETPNKGEDFTGIESDTQPGMALTPQQIVERFTSGRPMAHIPGYYEFDGKAELKNPMPDISRYSLIDQVAYYKDIQEQLKGMADNLIKGTNKNFQTVLDEKIKELNAKAKEIEEAAKLRETEKEGTTEEGQKN